MTRPLRIAVARISHETNARSPLDTTAADFQRSHWLEGDALGAALAPGAHEVPHFLRRAELAGAAEVARADGGVTLVPLLSAWTVPGGPLTPETWDALSGGLLARLDAAGPVDGVLLVLHGALSVRGIDAPEAALMRAVRARLPAHGRLAVSYDLHAHLTRAKVDLPDVLVAYHTNPHRDFVQTGRRAMTLLVRTLRGEVRPTTAWRSLPMVLGGGTTIDLAPGMWRPFRMLRRLARHPGILDASLFICHPWIDDPSPCWAVHVTTDGDAALAEATADALADAVWGVRDVPTPSPRDARDAVRAVASSRVRRRLGTAALVDTSDIVGAGAPGDHTTLLQVLRDEAPTLRSWVPLRDPDAVAALQAAAVGEPVALEIGGTWSAARHRIAVEGRVVHRGAGPGVGRTVTLDLGGPAVVLTEGPPLSVRPRFFSDAGLPVRRADIVVIKSLLLWLPHFLPHASRRMLVRTEGPTDFDAILRGPFAHPIHPVDVVDGWRAHDRAVRGAP